MATKTLQRDGPEPRKSVIGWLLDSDPSIRWQVMRDLIDESHEVVAGERSRVASEGWGSRLLDLQGPDGQWGGNTFFPHWTSTFYTLLESWDLGLAPTSERARQAIGVVRDNCTWGPEFGDSPFFEGEVEPCINGRVLALVARDAKPAQTLPPADPPAAATFDDGCFKLRVTNAGGMHHGHAVVTGARVIFGRELLESPKLILGFDLQAM